MPNNDMPNMVGTPSSQRQIPSCSPTEGLYFLLPHDAIRHSYVDTQLSRNASLRAWKEIEIINGEHRKPSESQPLFHKVPRMSVLALLMLLRGCWVELDESAESAYRRIGLK